ncbi:hypothetical protein [Methylobacterium ajmalii]
MYKDVTDYGANPNAADNWAAFQAAADTGFINIPPGDWAVERPIVTGSRPLFVRGAGMATGGTRILTKQQGDLFVHGYGAGQPISDGQFSMRDLVLSTTGPGVGTAIKIRQNMNSGGFFMENVRFGSFGTSFNWSRYIDAEGTTGTRLVNVKGDGGSYVTDPALAGAQVQVGAVFRSPNKDAKIFVVVLEDCDISGYHHGIKFEVQGDANTGGSIEGIVMERCGGRSVTGPLIRLEQSPQRGGWRSPYFNFSHCNMEGPGTLMDLDAVSEFRMHDNLQFIGQAPAGFNLAREDYIKLRSVDRAYFDRNTFVAYAGSKLYSFIAALGSSRDVHFGVNAFEVSRGYTLPSGEVIPNASATCGIYCEGSTTGCTYTPGSKFRNFDEFGVQKINGPTIPTA